MSNDERQPGQDRRSRQRRFGGDRRRAGLTDAQIDVLSQLAIGRTYRQIAISRRIEYITVWRHAQQARENLGAQTVMQAVVWFVWMVNSVVNSDNGNFGDGELKL